MKIFLLRKYFPWCFMIWINCFRKRLWKLLGEIVKNSFKVSGWLCWAILLEKVPVLQLLSDFQRSITFCLSWQKNYWTLDESFHAVLSQYTSRCPAEPFEDEDFWSFLVLFFFNFWDKCLDFDHQFRSSLSALLSESLAEILKTCFWKRKVSYYFRTSTEKCLALCRVCFSRAIKTAILVSVKTIYGMNIFPKKNTIFL